MQTTERPKSYLNAAAITFQLPFNPTPEQHVERVNQLDSYLAPGVSLPKSGITLLYGTKNCWRLRQYLANESAEMGRLCRTSMYRVEVEPYPASQLTLMEATRSGFLNIPKRLRACTKDTIATRWNRLLADKGKPAENFPREISDNMQLLDELVCESPYNQLIAVSYEIRTIAGPAQVVTVFKPDAITFDSADPCRSMPLSGIMAEHLIEER